MSVREHENPFAKFKKTEVEAWLASPITMEVVRVLEEEEEDKREMAVALCRGAVDCKVQDMAVSIGHALHAAEAVKNVFKKAEVRLSLDDMVPRG